MRRLLLGSVAAGKTVDGKEYKNAEITRVEPDGITIKFSGGIVKILFTELSADLREKYHYDAEAAKAFTAKTRQDQDDLYIATQAEKDRQQKIREAEQQIKDNEKRIAANEAENATKLQKIIADHIFFVGMTREQAIQSKGEPDKVNRTITDGVVHEQWVYGDRQYWQSSIVGQADWRLVGNVDDHVREGWVTLPKCYIYFDNGILKTIQD